MQQQVADGAAERIPAAHAMQEIELGRQFGAERGGSLAPADDEQRGADMDGERGGEQHGAATCDEKGGDQHRRRDIGRRRPVGMRARQEADHQHHRQGRQRKDGQQARALVGEAARKDHEDDKKGAEEKRPEDTELGRQEFEERLRMQQRSGEVGVGLGVLVADEAVRRIPQQIGQIDQMGDRRRASEAQEVPPLVANGEHQDERREQPVLHRVFGEQADPGGDADDDPPAPSRTLARANEGIERDRPAQHQRHVGRHDGGGQRHRRQGRIEHGGPAGGSGIVKPPGDRVDDEPGRHVKQRRGDANGELVLAEDRCRQRDDPGQQWRLREIAERQMARPQPVLRLVGIKIDRIAGEPNEARRGDGKQRVGGDALVVSLAHRRAGHRRAGHRRAGHRRAGHRRAGHRRAGHRRAAHRRAGHRRAGHRRAGHRRVGRHRVGRERGAVGCRVRRDHGAAQTIGDSARPPPDFGRDRVSGRRHVQRWEGFSGRGRCPFEARFSITGESAGELIVGNHACQAASQSIRLF